MAAAGGVQFKELAPYMGQTRQFSDPLDEQGFVAGIIVHY